MKKDKRPAITILPDFGKVPPQATEIEEVILGTILIDGSAINDVSEILKAESFYIEGHKKIFEAATDLFKQNKPVDLFTVSEQLRSTLRLEEVGGPVALSKMCGRIVSSANIGYYAKIVAQKYMQRELIRVSTEIQSRAFDDTYDIAELLEYTEMSILEISGRIYRTKAAKIGVIIDRVIDQIAKIQSGEIKLIGVPSGFTKLDRVTAGFKKKELTIIAARPSMGKTAIAIQIAQNAASIDYPVAIFSCEMSEDEIGRRILSGVSGYTNMELLNGKCDIDTLCKKSTNVAGAKIYIDDKSSISITEVRAKVRRMIIENNIKLVIVDYLQLMKGDGESREQVVSDISRGLKSIAKDMDIPVIALAQLNREVEKRPDRKPMLSDLRESGSIEMDSDVVMFIHRPEKYGFTTYEIGGSEVDSKNLMLMLIAKNRNGPIGEIMLNCNESLTNITDYVETSSFQEFVPRDFNDTDKF